MSAKLVKRYNAIGWDWYLVSDECESWVSHDVKEYIEQLESENAKLRELMMHALINLSAWMGYGHPEWMVEAARELGVEAD